MTLIQIAQNYSQMIYTLLLLADNGRKLFYTLHIRNVTMKYDSQSGPIGNYFCQAYAVNSTKYEKEHGFYINVIQGRISYGL